MKKQRKRNGCLGKIGKGTRGKASLLCAVSLLLGMLLSGCDNSRQTVPELLEPADVQKDTAVAVRQDCYSMVTYSGTVSPGTREVEYPGDGTLLEVLVSRGETVRQGQVLARMDQGQWLDTIESLEQQLEALQQEQALQQIIYQAELKILKQEESNLTAQEDMQGALAKQQEVQQKELEIRQWTENCQAENQYLNEKLEEAYSHAGEGEILAPCDGTVLYTDPSFVKLGFVQEGAAALYISDAENPIVLCHELQASQVRDASKLIGRSGTEEYTLTYLPYTSEETLAFALDAVQPPSRMTGETLPPCGSYMAVCVYGAYREDVITVPPNAVHKDTNGAYVYCVAEDGSQQRRDVTVGLSLETAVEIQEGLQEGEVVYVSE